MLLLAWLPTASLAIKEVKTHKEFTNLLKDADGRPVIIDYYSQSCGPCHMIAPIYRRIAKEYAGRAYFRKIDVNVNRHTSSAQGVRSMPTFQFWLNGKKLHQFSGAGEGQLRDFTRQIVAKADKEDIVVTREALEAFYIKHDKEKATKESLDRIVEKNSKNFAGMIAALKKKYNDVPVSQPRPKRNSGSKDDAGRRAKAPEVVNLRKVSIEELREELERREEDLQDQQLEEEERRLANNPCSLSRNRTGGTLSERMVIIGGGPAGHSAALYAARANVCPLVIAPSIGGQLMAKGVDVENYPGLPLENGGKMIAIMKQQARSFFTEVWDDMVIDINTETRPLEIVTNSSGIVKAHTIILATGADSNWLGVEGEYEYRGHGVSSCAVCDGTAFKSMPCAVVGGGDTAMEEALFLSRICSSVTLIHRRDTFRASQVLVDRVRENSNIEVRTNVVVASFGGETTITSDGEEIITLTHVMLNSTTNPDADLEPLYVDAVFVAIGHTPNTAMLRGKVGMDEVGYIIVQGRSTATTVPGIFAAGDVADHTYRQAVTSAGSGAMAALDAERYLSEHPPSEETCVRQEDFLTWSLKEIIRQTRSLGLKCIGCSEKADYIKKLRAYY